MPNERPSGPCSTARPTGQAGFAAAAREHKAELAATASCSPSPELQHRHLRIAAAHAGAGDDDGDGSSSLSSTPGSSFVSSSDPSLSCPSPGCLHGGLGGAPPGAAAAADDNSSRAVLLQIPSYVPGSSQQQRQSSGGAALLPAGVKQPLPRGAPPGDCDAQPQQDQQDGVQPAGAQKQGSTDAAAAAAPQQPCAWREVVTFALPMLATLAADPLASLVDTAFVGHLGAAQLAGVGMAINIFSSITRLFNAPLLAVTTSTVAAAGAAEAAAARDSSSGSQQPQEQEVEEAAEDDEEAVRAVVVAPAQQDAAAASADAALKQPLLLAAEGCSSSGGNSTSKLSAAVSSALVLALAFSLVELCVLAPGARWLVSLWGAPEGSALRAPTLQFLLLRSLAAPVTVLLLVSQGVFRGLQDATTPLYATIACNALNILLEPPFIFAPLHLGVRGSALATAVAQSVPLLALLLVLRRRVRLALTGLDWAQLGAMFAPTGFLLLRTLSISAVFAVATSLVARAGPLAAAAHQVSYQLWMAASLLADSLAVASQTILARSITSKHLPYARRVVASAVCLSLGLGVALAAVLCAAGHSLPSLFTQDPAVLALARQLMPVVALSQPLNALAFVMDGVLYGAGGFKYASAVMLLCAAPSLGLMAAGQLVDGSGGSGSMGPPSHAAAFAPQRALLAAADGVSSGSSGSGLGPPLLLGQLASFSCLVQQPASLQGYAPVLLPGSGGWLGCGNASALAVAGATGRSSAVPLLLHGAANAANAVAAAAAEQGDSADAELRLPAAVVWVWAGMLMLMAMRACTILLPLGLRWYPFAELFADQQQHQQQHHDQQQPGGDGGQQDGERCDSARSLQRRRSALSASLRSLSGLLLAAQPHKLWGWRGRGSFIAVPASLPASGDGHSRRGGGGMPRGAWLAGAGGGLPAAGGKAGGGECDDAVVVECGLPGSCSSGSSSSLLSSIDEGWQ